MELPDAADAAESAPVDGDGAASAVDAGIILPAASIEDTPTATEEVLAPKLEGFSPQSGCADEDSTLVASAADGVDGIPMAAESASPSGDDMLFSEVEGTAAVIPASAEETQAVAEREPAAVGEVNIENMIDESLLIELRDAFVMGKHPGDEDIIDSTRLKGVLRSLGIGLSPIEYLELLDAADPSGIGRIPWKVFLGFTVHLAAARKPPDFEAEDLLAAFRLADSEGSGVVDFRDVLKVTKHIDQDPADRQAFLQALRMYASDSSMDYGGFVERFVTDRKWPPSFMGSGGVVKEI